MVFTRFFRTFAAISTDFAHYYIFIYMKKPNIVLSAIIAFLIAALGLVAYLLVEQHNANRELQELAELDKLEMEDQYREFDQQYGELQKQLKNDSLIAQIEEERRHTQELLEELERTKATDAAEITRLKKEIATLRKVLRSYIMQVDSLNRLNETLVAENTEMKNQVSEANTQISNLSTANTQLKDKVNIAAQLDATGFWVTPKNKKGRDAKKAKDTKKFAFGFTIVKNVTASNGERIVYARILKPDNSVMGEKGTFSYENTNLQYTEKKYIEYNGEEQAIIMYSDVEEFLEAGTYKLFVFCDKQMIGETSFTLQ
jgi:hypothetical protein